jgi:diguanylate cyclase (GGDEF)-like protein
MKGFRPIRARLVAVLVCFFAALVFVATILPMRSLRQNFDLLHKVSRLSSAQIVLLYIERSVEGEWKAKDGYLYKGLSEFADGETLRRALSDYLPVDSAIDFHVGSPPAFAAVRPGLFGRLPPRDVPPPPVPNSRSSSEPEKWKPEVPFLTDSGAGIVVKGPDAEPVGWISVESGQNWEAVKGNSRNISLIFGIVILNLGVILFFGVVVLFLTKPIDAISEAHERARARNAELSSLSRTDPLTGLLNRRGVEASLAGVGGLGAPPSCVAIIDIDHFKAVNDERGHEEGDRVLAAVAEAIATSVRSGDVCGRWGGEEFIVLFRDLADAQPSAERIRAAVEARSFSAVGSPLRVTVTIGIAAVRGGFAETLSAADAAMYRGKREGRNRVVAAQAFLT